MTEPSELPGLAAGVTARPGAAAGCAGAARRRPARAALPATDWCCRGVTVDRAHLAGYDRVCGFRLGDALPATYPHVLAFPLAMRLMTAPEFPFPLLGLVHVANRITVHRPVDGGRTAGPRRARGAALRPHDRGRQFDIVAGRRRSTARWCGGACRRTCGGARRPAAGAAARPG